MDSPESPVELPDDQSVSEDDEASWTPSEEFLDRVLRIAEPANEVFGGTAARSNADLQASQYCEDCQLTWMTAPPGSAADSEHCAFHDSLGGIRAEQRTLFVHVDGACPGNGKHNAVGGVGVYFGPSSSFNLSVRLANFVVTKPHTNQQAELVAATSALSIIRNDCIPARRQLLKKSLGRCPCHKECWAAALPFQVVIVTDSAYLFDCITSYLLIWSWDSSSRKYTNKKSGNIIKNSEHIHNIV